VRESERERYLPSVITIGSVNGVPTGGQGASYSLLKGEDSSSIEPERERERGRERESGSERERERGIEERGRTGLGIDRQGASH
jgi:hypothetical protein